jgi:hypothetical protein
MLTFGEKEQLQRGLLPARISKTKNVPSGQAANHGERDAGKFAWSQRLPSNRSGKNQILIGL